MKPVTKNVTVDVSPRTSAHLFAHITGVGLVTPLGSSAPRTWDSMLAGSFIPDHARIELASDLNLPRVSRLAIQAAKEAVESSDHHSPGDMALVVGTSKGPVESWLASHSKTSNPHDFGLSAIAVHLARTLEISGPRLTVSTACASGLHALMRGAIMIQTGEASRVLVVAAEASVHPMFIASFQRLGILPPPGVGCRPFDRDRQGFLMSEAAAAVVLESDPSPGSIAIDRVAMGADATHLTRNSDDAMPLRKCIEHVVGSSPIDLVHAHGTGTAHNDATELAALEQVFGSRGVGKSRGGKPPRFLAQRRARPQSRRRRPRLRGLERDVPSPVADPTQHSNSKPHADEPGPSNQHARPATGPAVALQSPPDSAGRSRS